MTHTPRLTTLAAAAAVLLALPAAQAMTFENEAGTLKGSFDSTMTFGFGRRLLDPACTLVGDPGSSCGAGANTGQYANGDNGNLNYAKGDFFSAYIKGQHELLVKLPADFKFMARGVWTHDFKATDTRRTDFEPDAEKQIERQARLLDFWVSKDLTVGEQSARSRLGNQVVNWGESIFLLGGINATSSMDLQKYSIPGTQLKEVFLPAPMLSFGTGLGHGWNADAYYQFRWKPNVFPPVGSYFSANDIVGKGKQPAYFSVPNFNLAGMDAEAYASANGLGRTPAAIRGATSALEQLYNNNSGSAGTFVAPVLDDKTPQKGGQYGVAAHYKPDDLALDLGFYVLNYHDKFPVLNYDFNAGRYQWHYLENRKLYGVSTNFALGNWAIGGELSYRPKEAISLTTCFDPSGPLNANVFPSVSPDCKQWIDNKKYQMHLTAQLQLTPGEHGHILSALGNASTAYLTFEGVVAHYPGVNAQKGYSRTMKGPKGEDVPVLQYPLMGYAVYTNPSTSQGTPANANTLSAGLGTATQIAYAMDMSVTYDNKIISGWTVTPGVTLYHTIKGDQPVMYPVFLEGNKAAYFYLLFTKNPATLQAGLNYTIYRGGDQFRQAYRDRDFIGGFVNYNF